MKLKYISANFHKLIFSDEYEVWFSYETPVAFKYRGVLYNAENEWGRTTGMHLNAIASKESVPRIPHSDLILLMPYIQKVLIHD